MISISTPTYSVAGSFVSLSGMAVARPVSRRAQRVATLDGGAVLVDGGYSAADMVFALSMPDATGAVRSALAALLANYPQLILSCADGCYSILLSNLDSKSGQTTATAYVLEALS